MNNDNIAILTLYYKNYNYGGLLQAYALQKVLDRYGNNVQQISYLVESGYDNWNPAKYRLKKIMGPICRLIRFGKQEVNARKRKEKFNKFAIQIPHTKTVTEKNITSLNKDFDLFICGSDQIWNPIGWQPSFFLSFAEDDKKLISYAASVARDQLSEVELLFIRHYINRFSAISVREKNTEEILTQEFPDLNIVTVIDPVFLLDKPEWETLIKNNKKQKNIFAYFLGTNILNKNLALEYANQLGMDIRFVGYMDKENYTWEKEHAEVVAEPMGPIEFLEAIHNAEFVITDSFHAVAFSCIFETPFYALPRFQITDRKSMNSRLVNLTETLEVKNRFVSELKGNIYRYKQSELDSIRQNIKSQRKFGLDYLRKALENTE